MYGKNLPRHEVTQGFITSYGRFVDRKEAMKIALECGQVKEEELGNKRIGLFSEDIFPHQEFYKKMGEKDAKSLASHMNHP